MDELDEARVDGVNSSSDAFDDARETDDRGVSGSTSSHLRLWPVSDSSASRADSFSLFAAFFTSAVGNGGSESSGKAGCHLPAVSGSNGCVASVLLLYQRWCSSIARSSSRRSNSCRLSASSALLEADSAAAAPAASSFSPPLSRSLATRTSTFTLPQPSALLSSRSS